MSRPDPIQYAERLYAAIRGANFSPISFLAFGSAVKDGVDLRRMPRIAAEPFMRVVGEMLDLEREVTESGLIDAEMIEQSSAAGDAERRTMTPVDSPASERPTDPDAIAPGETASGPNLSVDPGSRTTP